MPTFLLSPASCRGRRAEQLLHDAAAFPLAVALRAYEAPLGDVFAFVSGLYFRGKLAYARRFGGRLAVIAPGRGLLDPETRIGPDHVRAFAQVDVDPREPGYVRPLVRDAEALPPGPVVLLGSVATDKYLGPLGPILGERLLFPEVFAGMGDMKRGSVLLKAAASGEELAYVRALAAPRTGRQAAARSASSRTYSSKPSS